MFGKLSYSLSVARACWNVLRKSPGLMLFPLMSAVACGVVIASFALPIMASSSSHSIFQNSGGDSSADPLRSVSHYAILFAFYFCNYFVITFFNCALVACAIASLKGETPALGYGLSEATSRIHLIAGWALLSATVGVILRAVEERASFIGRIVAGLFGLAWAVASYLAVPVLVMESVGPIEAVKRSSAMLRKTWGERLAGSVGFSAIFFLLMLPAAALVAGSIAMAANGNHSVMFVGIAVAVVYVLALVLVQSTLATIFQAAVYLYANDPALLQASENQGHGFPVFLLSNAMIATK
jgi:hypothetical protein